MSRKTFISSLWKYNKIWNPINSGLVASFLVEALRFLLCSTPPPLEIFYRLESPEKPTWLVLIFRSGEGVEVGSLFDWIPPLSRFSDPRLPQSFSLRRRGSNIGFWPFSAPNLMPEQNTENENITTKCLRTGESLLPSTPKEPFGRLVFLFSFESSRGCRWVSNVRQRPTNTPRIKKTFPYSS